MMREGFCVDCKTNFLVQGTRGRVSSRCGSCYRKYWSLKRKGYGNYGVGRHREESL
jgi:hypothetical protein